MNDPYHSPLPVVNAIAGFFIAISILTVPLIAVSTERVKSNYKPTSSSLTSGVGSEEVYQKRQNCAA